MTDQLNRYVESARRRLKEGAITRRSFMTQMLAAGVAVTTAASWADKARAQTPTQGGLMRLGLGSGSTTDTLDPATYEGLINEVLSYMFGNNLLEIDYKGDLVPELAEAYDTKDAVTWAFTIRKGVEFHNGKTMTPEDVVASINHHRGENSKSAVGGLVSQIKDIRVDGDNVLFELSAANADFPYILTDNHLLVMPSKDGVVDAQSGIGTGGYAIKSYDPGVRISAARNPNYFKPDRAHFDEIEMLTIIDATARQNAVMNGSVDVIDRVDPKTVDLLSQVPILRIVEQEGKTHYTFPMRCDSAPFNNYDLRMAMKLAVDRQELVDKILVGHGALGNDQPISPSYRYYAQLPQRAFDPDKAAFHFKKSGHTGPLQLSVADTAFAGAVDAGQLIAASASKAGINVEVVREPNDGYWSNVWNKKPWCASYWSGRPTQDLMFASAYVADTEWNEFAWRTGEAADRFNKVIAEARGELDETKRGELYGEAQRLVNDDCGALLPMFANAIAAVSKTIATSEHVAPNWDLDGARAPERWWKA